MGRTPSKAPRLGLLIFLAALLSGCAPLPQCYGNIDTGSSACVEMGQAFYGDSARVHLPGNPFPCNGSVFDPTLTYAEYQQWMRAGIQNYQIEAWECAGITDPSVAVQWRSEGFSPPEAEKWWKAGIGPDDAKELASASFDPGSTKNPGDSLAWARAGFSESDATLYAENAFTPKMALEWKANGFGCQEAIAWKSRGVTEAAAAKWKTQGISPDQVRNAEALLAAGYSQKRAVYYARSGVGPQGVRARDEQTKAQETYHRLVESTCHGSVHSETELLVSNPYTTSGRCYQVLAFVVQWLGPYNALMNFDFSGTPSGLMLVEFSEPPSTKVFQMLVLSEGAASYTSTDGSLMTVPKVRMLSPQPNSSGG